MPMQDQSHLTDIEEEGRTTLVKYSIPFELDIPTTIIATANQYNTEWENTNSVSKDEFPILKTLVDRSDQIYAFRDAPSKEELQEYTKQKTKGRKRRPHNYNFLKKLLIYEKSAIRPEMTAESEFRLNEFWTEARIKGVATNRTYDAVFRLAEAQAKLNLSGIIDDDAVNQAMQSLSLMLSQYGQIIRSIESPRVIAYSAFINILKQTRAPLSLKELHKLACDESKEVLNYLGPIFNIRDNHKLRSILDMLLNHDSIKQTQEKPIVLQWLGGASDASDASDTKTTCDDPTGEHENETTSRIIGDHNTSFCFGKWHCNDCKASGDRFYMQNTPCNGNGAKVKE
jgi:DNA replicative helicase MCM subunit Mcm2 (Cdc46/Mcm family)